MSTVSYDSLVSELARSMGRDGHALSATTRRQWLAKVQILPAARQEEICEQLYALANELYLCIGHSARSAVVALSELISALVNSGEVSNVVSAHQHARRQRAAAFSGIGG